MKTAIFDLAEFTPSEVEAITGLSTGAQRDWRHRGLIESVEGHARFDILDLAGIYAQKALADRGIGPQRSADVKSILSEVIAWHALIYEKAYDGNWCDALELTSAPATQVKDEQVEGLLKLARSKFPRLDLPKNFKTEILRQKFFKSIRERVQFIPRVVPGPILIWWSVGEPVFQFSYDHARGELAPDDPKLHGPAIVFDLASAGRELVHRARRPFVLVTIE